jgi:hypothetical protein
LPSLARAPTALPETRAFCGLQAAATEQAGLTVIPGDYRIGATLLTVATFLGPGCHLWTQFFLHGVLGGFLCFQASRVRFRFSDTALDVVFIEPGASDATALAADTETSGDNKLQGGGANKWALSSITNWCAPRRRKHVEAMTLHRSRMLARQGVLVAGIPGAGVLQGEPDAPRRCAASLALACACIARLHAHCMCVRCARACATRADAFASLRRPAALLPDHHGRQGAVRDDAGAHAALA